MKPEKVLKCSEFVLWLEKHGGNMDDLTRYITIVLYAKLIQLPLALEMFVPCKQNGELAENPEGKLYGDSIQAKLAWSNYKGASSRVLFEGWKINEIHKGEPEIYTNGNCQISDGEQVLSTYDDWFLKENKHTIEDLADKIDLIPTANFWAKVGLT